jgi:hypothetical protein
MSPLRRLDVATPSTADFLDLGDANEVAPVNLPIGNLGTPHDLLKIAR